MAQARAIHGVVQNVTSGLRSADSSQTPSTHSTTGEDQFTKEQKAKTVMFFGRLQLIYGHRFAVQWPDEVTVRRARREWAMEIDRLTWEQLQKALNAAKAKLMDGDPDYYWPDVGRILALGLENRSPAHKPFKPGLPVTEDVKAARKVAGQRHMGKIWQMMGGRHAE